ncbi:hypothetical protein PV08_04660 [Exophiala spinifera]|uniref:Heterokaryon incompatibility domain-containing protein n=1 Tax=Exophiala spinifera TaxID=91928 RepID=A0A0D1YQG4_9EURO|nr:uncharacterized protein PV08_04660 [Exophiala spinifera]KIW17466.1 hypothetical protein PV08_04660 [Exophiala spinifera]
MAFCTSCKGITLPSASENAGHPLHDDWLSLQRSAETCDLCRLFLDHLRANIEARVVEEIVRLCTDHQRPLQIPIRAHYIRGMFLPEDRHELQEKPAQRSHLSLACGPVKENEEGSDDGLPRSNLAKSLLRRLPIYVGVPVYVYPGDPLSTSRIQIREALSRTSLDLKVLTTVKQWRSHCLTTHPECRLSDSRAKIYPTRLLHLRNVKTTGTAQIVRTSPSFPHDYVALSYCWGAKYRRWLDYVKACQRDQDPWIEIDQMPQTLLDAVASTLALDFEYLWIDCLCILQGNKKDWLEEGSKMCEIYGNAALTISASDSRDCRDGFIAIRTPLQREGIVFPCLDESGATGNLHFCAPGTAFDEIVGRGPVARRAWCLQERQISRQVLHVCRSEVFFECVRCLRHESERRADDEFDPNDEWWRFHVSLERQGPYAFPRKPSPDVYNVLSWCGIVEDYSRRDLAFVEDKLAAIAGLARRAQRILDSEYLAGLWMHRLHIGLSWQIAADMHATRASVYRAPSWSWASIDGPVSYDRSDGFVQSDDGFLESAIQVRDTSVSLVGSDPFGPVQYVDVTVSGLLKQIPPSDLLQNSILEYPAWMSGAAPQIGWYLEDEKRVLLDSGTIACLKIAVKPFGPGPSLPPTNSMLILERVGDHHRPDGGGYGDRKPFPTYKRVGFGQVFVTDYFDDCSPSTITLI